MSQSFLKALKSKTGFSKTFNLVLFCSTACVFSMFCVYRLKSINYGHWSIQSRPGEWFWFKDGFRAQAMKLHLWSVIPAGAFMPLQFVPKFRKNYIAWHKALGRFVLILLIIGNITAVIISPWAFGGTITTQIACISLATLISFSMVKGIRGILAMDLEAHRAWMLRTWAYAGAILTMRPINIILHIIASTFEPGKFQAVSTCEQLISMYKFKSLPVESLLIHYPQCVDETASELLVIVQANLSLSRPDQTAALTTMTFGVALWAGTVINLILVEWYLHATKDEDERLRIASKIKKKTK